MAIARNDNSVLGRWWWTVDRLTLAALLVIAGIGMVLIVAASPSVAERIGASPFHFVRKQAILLVPALAIMIGVSLLDPKSIRRFAAVMLGCSIVLMFGTLAFGAEIKGATRWVSIAGITIQPSEFAKPAFAVIAGWLLSAQRLGEDVPGYFIAAALYILLVVLLLSQPDLGQTVVMTTIAFAQAFLSGLPMLIVFGLGALAMLGICGAYFFFPHVQSRIDRFFDPAVGDNFQVHKSLDAFMSGGIFGRGPGEGIIKNSLPDSHADFIFAVAGEEFGLIVCLFIVFLFAFVVLRGFVRLLQSDDLYIVLAATGLLVQFALQALINMASTLNLIPTKGMTLPFISYGGSSLIALAIAMGMLLALTRKRPGGLL